MTKVSSKSAYPIKKPVKRDYFVGTDSENNGKTVNFDFEKTAKLINELSGTSIVNYLFKTDNNIPLEVLTEGVFLSEGNETTFADITKLYINKKNFHETDMAELFQFIALNKEVFTLKIRNSSNLNNAVYFNITASEEFETHFILDVSIDINNASIPELIHFNVYFFDFELKSSGTSGGSDPLKLDKSTYTGNAQDIDDRIVVLENLQDLSTNFTGQAFAVWTGVGYVYDVIYPDYYIQGVLYPGATQQITLNASDATYPRFDVIYVNALGAQKATGIPALNPLIPTIDEGIELFVTSELVTALSTTPVDSSIEQVYNENTEWTTSSLGGLVNFNATNRPSKGVKNADIVNPSSGMFTQFVSSTTKSISDFNTLKFDLFFVENYGKTHGINVYFLNGSNTIGSYVIKTGLNNYKFGSFGSYQSLVVDFSSFTFTGVSFDTIKIVFPWANAGFSIDNVVLVKGSSVVSPTQKAITSIVTDSGIANATIKDDTFTLKGGNGAVVSAVGKEITITPANQTKTQVGLGNVDNTSDINKPISTAQQTALDSKLDASSYNQHFKGKYTSSGALTTAHPTATDGDYAIVDSGTGVDAKEWIWDNEAGWIVGGATGASTTDALPEGSTNLYWTVARFLANLTYANVIAALGFTPSTAPNNAQKNSDITKAEIEAKLTGEITTHTHPEIGGDMAYKNVIHLGNSITRHPITSFWWGDWGMAATIRENDYVHRFLAMLQLRNPTAISGAFHISAWETNYVTFDKTTLDPYLVGRDLVVLRLGENVTYYADFQNQYKILVQYIQSKVPNATIILGGQFWTNAQKETAMQNVAVELGLPFVSVKHLDSATYKQTMGAMVYGDDLAWHAIDNGGVAIHPNDLGMLEIAKSLFSAIDFRYEIEKTTPQKEIIGNVTLDDSYNGCIVKIKATANITVPATLKPYFNCVFDSWTGFTGTFIVGAGVTISSDGLKLLSEKMATLYKDGAAPVYRLKGETSV